jgi:hypothetical protein
MSVCVRVWVVCVHHLPYPSYAGRPAARALSASLVSRVRVSRGGNWCIPLPYLRTPPCSTGELIYTSATYLPTLRVGARERGRSWSPCSSSYVRLRAKLPSRGSSASLRPRLRLLHRSPPPSRAARCRSAASSRTRSSLPPSALPGHVARSTGASAKALCPEEASS